MGFFDNKIIELVNKLSDNLDKRAVEVEASAEGKSPGESFTLKTAAYTMREVALTIRKTLDE
jgi:hypothetical protein